MGRLTEHWPIEFDAWIKYFRYLPTYRYFEKRGKEHEGSVNIIIRIAFFRFCETSHAGWIPEPLGTTDCIRRRVITITLRSMCQFQKHQSECFAWLCWVGLVTWSTTTTITTAIINTEENHSNEHASYEIPPLTNIFESPIILSLDSLFKKIAYNELWLMKNRL